MKKIERESTSHVGFGYIMQPEELRIELLRNQGETERELSVKFSSAAQR